MLDNWYICYMIKAFTIDIEYLCQKMSDMSGLPIRIYREKELNNLFSVVPLVVDPVSLYLDDLYKHTENVSYFITPETDYYGIINSEVLTIIIGPSRQTPHSNQELRDLAFELNVTGKDFEAFALSIRTIAPIPLDSMIQMMCSLNHVLNGEKLSVSDFQITETGVTEKFDYENPASSSDAYRAFNVEKQIGDIVRSGDTLLLEQWAKEAPTVRGGTLSRNYIRQNKNTLIVTTAVVSRIAISCGMNVDEAFRLSDSLIQRCENTNDIEEINKLMYETVYTYTREVGKLKKFTDNTRLINDVYYYIVQHISEPITTQDLADSLYMSRSYLSSLFKKSYGKNLNDFIHEIKIDRAKELLKDNSKSITRIADYLGYASSSHFNRVFREFENVTPGQYRNML